MKNKFFSLHVCFGELVPWVFVICVMFVAGVFTVAMMANELDLSGASRHEHDHLRIAVLLRERSNNKELIKLSRYVALEEKYNAVSATMGSDYRVTVTMIRYIDELLRKDNECGFTVDDVLSVMVIESRFNPKAKSHAGAIGLMQIMPKTAKQFGYDPKTLWDAHVNIEVGIRVLSEYAKLYGCDKRLALLAYNRGPRRVSQLIEDGLDPSNTYPERVMRASGL